MPAVAGGINSLPYYIFVFLYSEVKSYNSSKVIGNTLPNWVGSMIYWDNDPGLQKEQPVELKYLESKDSRKPFQYISDRFICVFRHPEYWKISYISQSPKCCLNLYLMKTK